MVGHNNADFACGNSNLEMLALKIRPGNGGYDSGIVNNECGSDGCGVKKDGDVVAMAVVATTASLTATWQY
jgi:hypothetical protein